MPDINQNNQVPTVEKSDNKSLQPVRKVLPLIPLRNIVLFPSVETSLFFGRKELELMSQRKIFLDLNVQTDKHWPERDIEK